MIVVIYGVLFDISCVLGIFFVNLVKLFIVKIILRMYLEKKMMEKRDYCYYFEDICVLFMYL